ncbi:hypothetical protein E2C01_005437 [Portunus trituberculatus]|uniref:Uncharacterized protein n=1 Tax=Portunus trituberculatus TaxID=210409 RepID=A0A5B7CSS9_PORTR|nr:hypothetical protein [Portunus trituberculatus]
MSNKNVRFAEGARNPRAAHTSPHNRRHQQPRQHQLERLRPRLQTHVPTANTLTGDEVMCEMEENIQGARQGSS